MIERPFWQRLIYAVFPTIKRGINVIAILSLRIFRSTVKTIFNQI